MGSETGGSLMNRSSDLIFSEFSVKGAAADPQMKGGLSLIPVVLLQDLLEQNALIF